MHSSYGTSTNDTVIRMNNHEKLLNEKTRTIFPQLSETLIVVSQRAQEQLDEISGQKANLEQRTFKVLTTQNNVVTGVMAFTTVSSFTTFFTGLALGNPYAMIAGFALMPVPLVVSLLSDDKPLPCLNNDKQIRKIADQLEVAQKKKETCMALCYLTSQLAELQEAMRIFYAKPNDMEIKGLFDDLAGLVKQLDTHIGRNISPGVYNLVLMAEICRALKNAEKSEQLTDSWQAVIDINPKETLWSTNDHLPWDKLHLKKPTNEEWLKYFELCEKHSALTAVQMIHTSLVDSLAVKS
jgi:hypothetical protein